MRKITLTLPYVENPSNGLERLAGKIMDESVDSNAYQQELFDLFNALNKLNDSSSPFALIVEASGVYKTRKVIIPPAIALTTPAELPKEERMALLNKMQKEQRDLVAKDLG